MTITFENDNDVIVYALEKIISHARRTQQVFVAQCVWWLVSIIGLEQGLIIPIDKLLGRTVNSTERHSERVRDHTIPDASIIHDSKLKGSDRDHQDTILKEVRRTAKGI
jgi:hypothetical protein